MTHAHRESGEDADWHREPVVLGAGVAGPLPGGSPAEVMSTNQEL
ncbi:hypothetical protein [Streptomyces antioxidans]|nr:hypothetical protein [Streptomyces antioxidans]